MASITDTKSSEKQAEAQEKQKQLLAGIDVARQMIDCFLNNRLDEAFKSLEAIKEFGIYEANAHSTVLFFQAMSTIEEQDLKSATKTIQKHLVICNQRRRRPGLYEALRLQLASQRTIMYEEYPEDCAHAELCYAESLLQFSFLSMLQDDKLSGLVSSSLKIRQCFKCYKRCWRIMKHSKWENEESRTAFESGVRLGVGAFNLMISMLPKRILKLMEFVGFSGDRELGLQQLRIGAELKGSLRAPLCALILLVYDLYGIHMLGDTVTNIQDEMPGCSDEICQLLANWRCVYPDSAIFLILAGRAEACFSRFDQAIALYHQSLECKTKWVQYKHICYWELMWLYALKSDWLSAIENVEKLYTESTWSPASYRYLKAVFILEFIDQRKAGELEQADADRLPSDEELLKTVDQLFDGLSALTHRFVGKSLPLEKIALKRSKRYLTDNRQIVLPALELLYAWNAFKMLKGHHDDVTKMLVSCDAKINQLFATKDNNSDFAADYCLALLLKGVCLRARGQSFQASMCFQEIITKKKELKSATFLLPFSEMELCQIYFESEDFPSARQHLDKAMSYKGYSLEARLQFRIHAMDTELTQNNKNGNKQSTMLKRPASTSELPVKSGAAQDGQINPLLKLATTSSNSAQESPSSIRFLEDKDKRLPGFDDDDVSDLDSNLGPELESV